MTLGQRIQELRKQAGLSQEGLGEALGVSRQAVSKWESDGGIPELDTLIAMSKMFGISIGELLGVEQPEEKERESTAALNEEQVEAILRRYAEESRRPEPEGEQKYPAGSWAIAAVAIVAAVALVILGISRIGGMRNTIRDLQSQLSTLQSNLNSVSNQVSNISGNLREQVEQALEEGNKLVSTFGYEVVDFDPEAETVTLRFDATLKDYAAGSKLQIHTYWIKTDQTEGQTDSDWVEGPNFSGEITLPMNFHTEVSVRVKDSSGNVREQSRAEVIYSLHPESFELDAYNLMHLIDLTIAYRYQTYKAGYSEDLSYVDIISSHPEYVWPERAVLTVYVNGEKVMEEELDIVLSSDDEQTFEGRLAENRQTVSLKELDKLELILTVTDNLGRVKEFAHGGTVNDGELEEMPMAAPAARPD